VAGSLLLKPDGLSTGCFYRTSIFEALAPIRESGFSLIEISSSPGHFDFLNPDELKRLATRLRDLELVPFSFHAPLREELDITAADEGRRRRAVEQILTVAEAAAGLQAGHLIVHPGPDHLLYDLRRQIGRRLRVLYAHDNHGGRDDHLPPGQGRIDWELLLRRLAEQKFEGPLILELSGDHSSTLLQDARSGREVLERIKGQLS